MIKNTIAHFSDDKTRYFIYDQRVILLCKVKENKTNNDNSCSLLRHAIFLLIRNILYSELYSKLLVRKTC